jgi:PHP domain-containing protein
MTALRRLAVVILLSSIAIGTLTDPSPRRQPITVDGYEVLSGDFHVHAFVGDGGIAPWMLQRHAERVGLDVIAITNHNQTLAARIGRSSARQSRPLALGASGPLILVGEEITGRDFHLVAVGIEHPVNWDQPVGQAIADVHAQHGVAIAAHPVRQFAAGYDDAALAALDGVEAAHPDSLSARDAPLFTEFYRRTLARNPAVAAIGSSDFHTNGPMGLCRTYVLVRERSEAGVIDAIRDGRTVGRCFTSELRGRPELVRLLEPYSDALAVPRKSLAQVLTMFGAWVALVALAILGTRS